VTTVTGLVLTFNGSKRRGLDKALFQIDQVVRRVQSGSGAQQGDDQFLAQLRELLQKNRDLSLGSDLQSPTYADGTIVDHDDSEDQTGDEEEGIEPQQLTTAWHTNQSPTDSLAVDDAENPLQLLARASYLQPSPESRQVRSPRLSRSEPRASKTQETQDVLYHFFAPPRAKLDVGDDVDPITLGLVSDDEATSLFD
jgi:hypothetical protein